MSEQNSAITEMQGHRNLLVLLFAGFVLSGIATTIIGPMLPIFIRRWSLDDGQAGLFSTIQFLAALGGTLASSAIAAWRGYKPALVLGYALMGGGLACLNANTHSVVLTATAVFGLGYGLITPGTNLFVAELGGAKSASLLNQLNFAWGVGAMICSVLIAFALKHNTISILLAATAIFGGILVVGLSFTSFGVQKHEKDVNATGAVSPAIGLGITIAMAAMFFIYVAMENGIGFWSAEYAKRVANGITYMTTLAPMFFYAGLTSGRAAAPLVLKILHERKLVLGALNLEAAASVLLITSRTLPVATTAVFLAGLGCASVYPIFIAWLSRWYGARAKKIGGILFALASLGGSAGSESIGVVSKFSGSLRAGFLVPLSCAAILIFLTLLLRRQTTA
ncbi:MAG TPA: MFS transporter [Candidatus Limnocylindria bacterium]|jgi:fucose permease|nr:MFS transporter [Candidatus Limnocylindria bacterium]